VDRHVRRACRSLKSVFAALTKNMVAVASTNPAAPSYLKLSTQCSTGTKKPPSATSIWLTFLVVWTHPRSTIALLAADGSPEDGRSKNCLPLPISFSTREIGNHLEPNPSCWALCRRLPVSRRTFFKAKSWSMPVSLRECHGQLNGKLLGLKILLIVSSAFSRSTCPLSMEKARSPFSDCSMSL
jgi:hypothetical protein